MEQENLAGKHLVKLEASREILAEWLAGQIPPAKCLNPLPKEFKLADKRKDGYDDNITFVYADGQEEFQKPEEVEKRVMHTIDTRLMDLFPEAFERAALTYRLNEREKGESWKTCSIAYLKGKLSEELDELDSAPENMKEKEASDVVLIALMLAQRYAEERMLALGTAAARAADN